MSEDEHCICCGSIEQVEETILTEASGKKTEIMACEACYMSGRIFHPELWMQEKSEEQLNG